MVGPGRAFLKSQVPETVAEPATQSKLSEALKSVTVVEGGEVGRMMALLKLLNRPFLGPAGLKFVAMGIAPGGFALCSFNLLLHSQANSA
jgi:hypothetical protein